MNIKIGALIIGGLAAYAYYRFSKMDGKEREDMINNLKQKGKKLYDDYFPSEVKDTIQKNFSTE
jgi:hypothetical protein